LFEIQDALERFAGPSCLRRKNLAD